MSWKADVDLIPVSPRPTRPPAYEALIGNWQPYETGSIRQMIPIFGRESGELALAYGYPDLQSFCDDLPEAARVLDVGSGASTLGLDVCVARPDVRWVNADLCYEDQKVRGALQKDAPPNLEILAADVLDLTERTGAQRFHRVFSWYLLQHIRLAGRKPAEVSAKEILQAAEPGGSVAAGPAKRKFVKGKNPSHEAIVIKVASSDEELDEQAKLLVDATEQPFLARLVQGRINQSSRILPI